MIILIIGLGNPDEKYQLTRHNAGQIILHKLFPSASWLENKKLKALIAKSAGFVLVKPLVFMNEVGQAVKSVKNYYCVPVKKILIIHDDSDIIVGKYKLQLNKSSAGHKCVESIIQHLGTKDFWRLRIGVRPQDNSWPAEKLVLKKFNQAELKKLMRLNLTYDLIEKIMGENK